MAEFDAAPHAKLRLEHDAVRRALGHRRRRARDRHARDGGRPVVQVPRLQQQATPRVGLEVFAVLRAARVEQQHRRAVAVEHVLGEGAQRGASQFIRLRRERGAVLDAERGAGPGALGRREVQGALRLGRGDLGLGGDDCRRPRRRARRRRWTGDEGLGDGPEGAEVNSSSDHRWPHTWIGLAVVAAGKPRKSEWTAAFAVSR